MQDDAARPEAATAPLEVCHTAVQINLTPALSAHRPPVLQTRLVCCCQASTIRSAGSHIGEILYYRSLLRAHGDHPLLELLQCGPPDRLPCLRSA